MDNAAAKRDKLGNIAVAVLTVVFVFGLWWLNHLSLGLILGGLLLRVLGRHLRPQTFTLRRFTALDMKGRWLFAAAALLSLSGLSLLISQLGA